MAYIQIGGYGTHLHSFVRSGSLSRAMKGSPQQLYLHCEVYLHVQNQPADDEVQISMVLYTHGEFTTTFSSTMF